MKRYFPLIVVALFSVTGVSRAKPKGEERPTFTYGCAKFDVNQNGILDPEEIAELRKAFDAGDTALKPLDVNNDGKLDDKEIAAIKLPKPAGKPQKR